MKSLANRNICNTRTNGHNSYGISRFLARARTIALSNLTFGVTLVNPEEK